MAARGLHNTTLDYSRTRFVSACSFATWHHLRRIRTKSAAGESTRGPVHSAKQEITETVKFLMWLHETYQRTAATCTQ